MTAAHEVRRAAGALKVAIEAAVAEGYRVAWPASTSELDGIAISETAKVHAPPASADQTEAAPVATARRRRAQNRPE